MKENLKIGLMAIIAVALVILITQRFFMSDTKEDDGKKKQVEEGASHNHDHDNLPLQTTDPNAPKTTVSFDESEFDFGTIKDGDKVSHIFKFTNTGINPLIISNAKGSCGCTVPSWPREPIAPNATGVIVVEFDSKGKAGQQKKAVTIQANTEQSPLQLYITATVEKQDNPG